MASSVVLDARDLRELRKLEGPRSELSTSDISSDSTLFAATTPDGLAVWRLADGVRVATVALPPKPASVSAIAFSPDSKGLWVGTTLGNVLEFGVGP